MYEQDARNSLHAQPSKQTMYIAQPDHMSPRFQKRNTAEELQTDENMNNFRRTQPNFHISQAKASADTTNKSLIETPKQHASPRRSNIQQDTNQQNLLNKIAEPQERRPYYLHQQPPRRFRNTASSFVSDQSSVKQDSIHNMVALNAVNNNKGTSNDDLADVSLNKKKAFKDNKQQRQRWNYPNSKQRKVHHMTNLAQAYSKGVEKLIQTLPFQLISRVQPIQTGAYRVGNTSPTGAQEKLRRSQHSNSSLPESSAVQATTNSVRKSIQLGTGLAKDDSNELSGNLLSHASLQQPSKPLSNIKSSIFNNDGFQDYDFALSNRLITEYQSQNQLFTQSPNEKKAGKGLNKSFIQQTFSPQSLMSQPAGVKLAQIGVRTSRNQELQLQAHKNAITSTERNIQAILERADYHKLKQHKDVDCVRSDGTGCDTCTCNNHPTYRDTVSKSFDYSNMRGVAGPSPGRQARKPARNVLSIQLRPLKGRAALMREYKTMIQEEYGKEKKKQIYETMYSPLGGRNWAGVAQSMTQASPFMNIRLNLRNEPQPTVSPCRQRDVVQLRTIAPGGQICDEVVQLDEESAEQMNMTMASIGGSAMTNRTSNNRYDKKVEPSMKQFYLFSPNNMTNSRYKDITLEKSEVSLLNLKIDSAEMSQKNVDLKNKMNLGYIGLSELRNLQADAQGQDLLMRRDDGTLESTTEMNSQHVLLPIGNKSRLSKNASSRMPSTHNTNGKLNIREMEEPLQVQPAKIGQKVTPVQQAWNQRKAVQFQLKNPPSRGTRPQNQKKETYKLQKTQNSVKRTEGQRGVQTQVASPMLLSNQNPERREIQKRFLKLNENSTMNVTIQSELTSSFLQLPGTRQRDDPIESSKNDKKMNTMMSDFNHLINNAETPDLSHSGAYASLDERHMQSSSQFDPMSNPGDAEISKQAVNSLHDQKIRQLRHIEKKMQDALRADEHLGVLKRKPVQIKKQTNHKRISQIQIIDEFYGKDDTESSNYLRQMAFTMPHGGFSNYGFSGGLRQQ